MIRNNETKQNNPSLPFFLFFFFYRVFVARYESVLTIGCWSSLSPNLEARSLNLTLSNITTKQQHHVDIWNVLSPYRWLKCFFSMAPPPILVISGDYKISICHFSRPCHTFSTPTPSVPPWWPILCTIPNISQKFVKKNTIKK